MEREQVDRFIDERIFKQPFYEDSWAQYRRKRADFLMGLCEAHSRFSSFQGVLLEEILRGSDYQIRASASDLYGLAGYRRGFRSLANLAQSLEGGIEGGSDDHCDPGAQFFGELLILFGRMDTREAHAFLVRVLKEWSDGRIRSYAIDGMAYERRQFKPKLVLPFVVMEAHPHVIQCALYALMIQRYFYRRRGELEERVLPLLKHEDAGVRDYVIMIMTSLHYSSKYRSVYEELLEDESDRVRWSAEGAILAIEQRLLD